MSAYPHELVNQWEDASYLGECDWGHCNYPQVGWAWCGCGDPYCGDHEWLSICAACLERGGSKPEAGDHSVAGRVTFDQIEADCSPTEGGQSADD